MQFSQEFCSQCVYNKVWDCKNCFVNQSRSIHDKRNLLITLILTRQCNFRCNYCTIDFEDKSVRQPVLDALLGNIFRVRDHIGVLSVEFFWGEPLLEFQNLRYIVENTRNLEITYSTYTNGHLFNEENMDFFIENSFREVVFSVSSHNMRNLSRRKWLFRSKDLSKFVVNLIIEPGNERNIFGAFVELVTMGFQKFSLIPVHHSKKWSPENIIALKGLLEQLHRFYTKIRERWGGLVIGNYNTNFDKETHGKKEDVELLIDWDGSVYADSETELWLLKDFVPREVFDIWDVLLGNISTPDRSLLDLMRLRESRQGDIMEHLNDINDHLDVRADLLNTGEVLNLFRFQS